MVRDGDGDGLGQEEQQEEQFQLAMTDLGGDAALEHKQMESSTGSSSNPIVV